jgi:EAL domain-containing protein (putative c-di-GMP-specific phosphodiesterase class I)
VIKLAHALGFEVVAEGVETESQLAALVDLGCDVVQGHVKARPLEADAAMAWLAAHERATAAANG